MKCRPSSGARALLAATCLGLASCASLLGLDELERVDCGDDCGSSGSGATSPSLGGNAASGAATQAGTSNATTGGKSGSGSGGSAGTLTGGTGMTSDAGADGLGGEGPGVGCGGTAPPETWSEHWFEHTQNLTLESYQDCVAVYPDADMEPADVQWLTDFVRKGWAYNLATYGRPPDARLFAIFHAGKYAGGHMLPFYEPSHDFRTVIDAGADDWSPGDYDLPAHLLSFAAESTAVRSKQGSPASWIWGPDAFAEIYKYDLYVGLGMQEEADAAWDEFEPVDHLYPVPESYWFADFYYPLWRDYGQTQVLVKFFALLEEHYPATNGVMGDMTWGEYIHFMSGAAGHEVKTQATYAFGWDSDWEASLVQAKSDFPAITY